MREEKIGKSLVEWNDALMVHGWPECGPGSLQIEELYQAFKLRLAMEDRHSSQCPKRQNIFTGHCECGNGAW